MILSWAQNCTKWLLKCPFHPFFPLWCHDNNMILFATICSILMLNVLVCSGELEAFFIWGLKKHHNCHRILLSLESDALFIRLCFTRYIPLKFCSLCKWRHSLLILPLMLKWGQKLSENANICDDFYHNFLV